MASVEERHDRATNIISRNERERNQRGEELGQVTTGKGHDEVVWEKGRAAGLCGGVVQGRGRCFRVLLDPLDSEVEKGDGFEG